MLKINDAIQWLGAVAVIAGHLLNTLQEYDYSVRPWNILAFTIGVLAFLVWSYRVRNHPQLTVNIVSVVICALGLHNAFVR